MKMQVKLYAEDGRRLWMNEYAVGLDVDAAIKIIDSDLNTKLSSISSNTQKALSSMTTNRQRRVQLWNGNSVTIEKRKQGEPHVAAARCKLPKTATVPRSQSQNSRG